MEKIRSLDWVKRITGMTESEFRENKQDFIYAKESQYTTPEMIIINKETKEEFSCGSLEVIPLKELRQYAKKSNQPATIELIVALDMQSQNEVNVSTMQAMPQYNNAVFLAASNFNGVESVSETIPPNANNFTTNYVYDHTQGPFASVGAPAAALQRTIFPFYDKKTNPNEWEQTQTKQIEMLKDVDEIYHVQNGYPMLDAKSKEPKEKDTEKFKGVIHSNVEVSMISLRGTIIVLPENERNRVDQVFAAATNVGQGISGYENAVICQDKQYIVKYTLDCGYETTYLTAIKNERQTIVLTLLGGGVFGNPSEMICQSIIDIHKKFGMKNNGSLEKVVLPFFSIGGGRNFSVFQKMLKEQNIPYTVTYVKNGVKV